MKNATLKKLIASLCFLGLTLGGTVAFACGDDGDEGESVTIAHHTGGETDGEDDDTIACGDDGDGDEALAHHTGGETDGEDNETIACGDDGDGDEALV